MLCWLLGLRFGPLAAEAIQRIETAGQAELDGWFERLESGDSWEDLLG